MKTLSIAALITLGMLPLQAGVVAESYEKAQAVGHSDGYVLVAYPQGWDAKGEKTAKRWLLSKAVLNAAGDSAVIPVPVPQITDDAAKEQQAQLLGKLKLPKASIYPALFLMDEDGRHYATVAEADMRRMDSKSLAPILSSLVEDGRRQKNMLDQAATLQPGVQKAELLGKASCIPNLMQPKDVLKQLRQCDPQDTLGYIRRLSYNPWGFATSTVKKLSFEESEKQLKEMLSDDAYTSEQKQQMYATYIGLLRRQAAPGSMERIAELMEKMKALNPESLLGKSAPIAARQWVRTFSVQEGWCPAVLPAKDATPLELGGPISISAPGAYELTFRYTSGKDALHIAAVELYDGNRKVAEDRHAATAGKQAKDAAYTLQVPAAVQKPRILVHLALKGKRDSSGIIIWRKNQGK